MRRSALVTGASTGIGRAVAEVLLQDGYAVTICARDATRLTATANELGRLGEVHAVPADVTGQAAVDHLLSEHRHRFGRLDVLVNNVGMAVVGPLSVTPVEQLDRSITTNVRTAWMVTTAAAPMLRKAGEEHGGALIANVSSILGRYPQGATPAYSAAKAALLAISESARQELAETGVRVTTLAPAFVATSMTEAIPHLDQDQLIRPRDLAEAVRFLTRLSPQSVVPEIQMLGLHDRLLPAL